MARLTERDIFGCRIRWIADVAQILRRHIDLDWEHVRRIATRSGGVNSVRVALAVVDEFDELKGVINVEDVITHLARQR